MLINAKCNSCKEKSKRVVGFYDGENGKSGNLFDCENISCPVKILMDTADEYMKARKREVAKTNLSNNIVAKNLVVARRKKGLLIHEVAERVGISSAELSAYESERKVIPKEEYLKIIECIGK